MSTLSKEKPTQALPGDLAMWIFILAELAAFTLFILAFTVTQMLYPEMFEIGRASCRERV